jgi:hypothetical protein
MNGLFGSVKNDISTIFLPKRQEERNRLHSHGSQTDE